MQKGKPSYEKLERQLASAHKRISDLEMSIKMSGDRERMRRLHIRLQRAEGTVEAVEGVLRMWAMTPNYVKNNGWTLIWTIRDAMQNWRANEHARRDSSTGPAP